MKEQFADYETSKMMKAMKYNEVCIGFYNPEYTEMNGSILFSGIAGEFCDWNKERYLISAPLWQQVKQWLWDEKNIGIHVDTNHICTIHLSDGDKIFSNYEQMVNSPITAETEGIKKAVEYLHSKIK